MKLRTKQIAVATFLGFGATSLVWAIPGYHVDDNASTQKAVKQFADDSFKFRAVIYQAQLDHNAWRLALAAYDYLSKKPGDPQRECSFAEAYWAWKKSQWASPQVGNQAKISTEVVQKLESLGDKAVKATKDAVQKMPDSVAAHLNYGNYLQYFGLMGKPENIRIMLNEYRKAVALNPNLGYTHYALASGYMGSGDESIRNIDKIIAELERSVALDPRLTQSYYYMAAVYSWPQKKDFVKSRFYLNKYLTLFPDEAKNPMVVPLDEYLKKKISRQ